MRILGIGNATVDIIDRVEQFPAEDDEIRALARAIRPGGNTLNTLIVLSQLGHDCGLLCSLANDLYADMIKARLDQYAISTTGCVQHENHTSPVSHIAVSAQTGSRTIIHYRDLPELAASALIKQHLHGLDWIHFEGRNIASIKQMLTQLPSQLRALSSLEIEKPHDGIESLGDAVKVILFSRAYARSLGFEAAEPFLRDRHRRYPAQSLVCAWGKEGAWGCASDGVIVDASATVTERVVDTVAAGDVFNAGIIHSCMAGGSFTQQLNFATDLAGKSCGQDGIFRLL